MLKNRNLLLITIIVVLILLIALTIYFIIIKEPSNLTATGTIVIAIATVLYTFLSNRNLGEIKLQNKLLTVQINTIILNLVKEEWQNKYEACFIRINKNQEELSKFLRSLPDKEQYADKYIYKYKSIKDKLKKEDLIKIIFFFRNKLPFYNLKFYEEGKEYLKLFLIELLGIDEEEIINKYDNLLASIRFAEYSKIHLSKDMINYMEEAFLAIAEQLDLKILKKTIQDTKTFWNKESSK